MHVTGDVNMYLYLFVSLLIPVCPLCLSLSNQSTSKNHVICVRRSVNLMPRLGKFRSIISLSKVTHKIWRGYTFSQRSKAAEEGDAGLGII